MARQETNWLVGPTICLFLIAASLPAHALDESLLLYLTFDSDTGKVARDATGKTQGGKIIGGAKVITSGAHSRALELNGVNGYVEIELSPEMIEAERDSFTAELWMQTRAQGIPEAGQWFIGAWYLRRVWAQRPLSGTLDAVPIGERRLAIQCSQCQSTFQ